MVMSPIISSGKQFDSELHNSKVWSRMSVFAKVNVLTRFLKVDNRLAEELSVKEWKEVSSVLKDTRHLEYELRRLDF